MSVGVVAKFPWLDAQPFAAGEPGAILFSDTRVTDGAKRVHNITYPKQRKLGPTVAVCFTSSDLHATSLAFDLSVGSGELDLEKFGRALLDTHQSNGGLTELLAVESKPGRDPEVLELMPPDYEPRPRKGIVGIGDDATLDYFKAHFDPIYAPPPALIPSTAVIEKLRSAGGNPVVFPPFTISYAGLYIAEALREAIEKGGTRTVGLPMQVMTFTAGTFRQVGVAISQNVGRSWDLITADPAKLTTPRFIPRGSPPDFAYHTAKELRP